MKKKLIMEVTKYISIFIVMAIFFSLCMIISYSIPNTMIREHIKESKDYILAMDNEPIFKEYIKVDKLDSYTDLLIINTALNKGKSDDESIIIRAFENSRYSEEKGNQYLSLEDVLKDDSIYNNQEYSRYWHGIQTIIRPLLLIFNYEELRFFLLIITNVLLIIATIYIYRNSSIFYAISFILSMLLIGFFIVPISLQYIGIFAIMLISVILINIIYQKKMEKLLPYLFFIVGGITTFMDLLTVPAITLGIPLIVMLLLKTKKQYNLNTLKTILEVIEYSVLWCITYVGIFISKWVIASIVLKKDAITVAINSILYRVNGSEEYPITRFGAICENFKFLQNKVLLFLIIIGIIVWIIALIKNRKKLKDMKNSIIYIIIALYPYVWYFVFAGHSTIHAWFTFRLQLITIFALLCAMGECVNMKGMSKDG